ncbi:MAG TPA: cyclic nucleotide-binding domain-containing protein [Pirellulaceae bacterium]|nr:cyclic nucleotide-binding domain-containing protein [Pirellulaceae bacterium]
MPAKVDPQQLQRVELFDNLTTQQAGEILAACTEVLCTAGRVIFETGQEERALYILLEGTVEVDVASPRAGERQLAQLEQGSVFGESSFFHASPHSATVKALTDAKLLRLDREQFNELLKKDNVAALRVAANAAKILAAKLQEADRCIAGLLEAYAGEKIHEAYSRFRESLGHSFRTPGVKIGFVAD